MRILFWFACDEYEYTGRKYDRHWRSSWFAAVCGETYVTTRLRRTYKKEKHRFRRAAQHTPHAHMAALAHALCRPRSSPRASAEDDWDGPEPAAVALFEDDEI